MRVGNGDTPDGDATTGIGLVRSVVSATQTGLLAQVASKSL